MIVPKININGVFQADLSGVKGEVIETIYNPETDDYTVILKDDGSTQKALIATSQLILAEKILNGEITQDRLKDFEAIFDCPEKDKEYTKDWILRDEKGGLIIVEKDGKLDKDNIPVDINKKK